MKNKLCAMITSVSVLAMLLSGCGGTATSGFQAATSSEAESEIAETTVVEQPQDTAGTAVASMAETGPEETERKTISFPLQGEELELSLFTSFPGNLTSYTESFELPPGSQAAEVATGVKIIFNAPSIENAAAQFDLIVASDDFNDIVARLGDMYQGGLASAYEGALIYDIAPLLEANAPDYQKVECQYN